MAIIVQQTTAQNSSSAGFESLKLSIANWLARDGDPLIAARIPDFIQFAESRMMYGNTGQLSSEPIRIRKMETLTTLTTTAGIDTVPLPVGYLAMRRLQLAGSPNGALRYQTPAQMDQEFSDQSAQSRPIAYTIEGDNIRLSPTPDAAYTINILYYQSFAQVSAYGNNWLLSAHPAVYLYAALVEASMYLGDDAGAVKYLGMYSGLVNSLQEQDDEDRHAGGALCVRADVRGR